MTSLWSEVRKYAPFTLIIGYLFVYMNKGYDRILVDLQAITPEKLMAKWQNFAIAAICLGVVVFLKKVKLPAALKAILILLLYILAGYQIGTAIDPPYYGGNGTTSVGANRYASGGR